MQENNGQSVNNTFFINDTTFYYLEFGFLFLKEFSLIFPFKFAFIEGVFQFTNQRVEKS